MQLRDCFCHTAASAIEPQHTSRASASSHRSGPAALPPSYLATATYDDDHAEVRRIGRGPATLNVEVYKDQKTQLPAPDSDIPRVQAVAALVVHRRR